MVLIESSHKNNPPRAVGNNSEASYVSWSSNQSPQPLQESEIFCNLNSKLFIELSYRVRYDYNIMKAPPLLSRQSLTFASIPYYHSPVTENFYRLPHYIVYLKPSRPSRIIFRSSASLFNLRHQRDRNIERRTVRPCTVIIVVRPGTYAGASY